MLDLKSSARVSAAIMPADVPLPPEASHPFWREHLQGTERVCLVEVGSREGLAMRWYAAQSNVEEIFGFEPLMDRYQKAVRNVALDPAVADKVRIMNCGWSNRYWNGTLFTGGTEQHVSLRDAGTMLRPLLARAERHTRNLVLRLDRLGDVTSEIFASLRQADALGGIAVAIVEEHEDAEMQRTLARLRQAGFSPTCVETDGGWITIATNPGSGRI